jgi:transposase
MLNMSQVESIKEQWSNGKSVSEIARSVSVDRNTVYKYKEMDNFNQDIATYSGKGRILDKYKDEVIAMLREDRKWFHKQRHTAKKIFEILKERHPEFDCSYCTVARLVAELRRMLRRDEANGPGTLRLVWKPGVAQADFGEADFLIDEKLERHKYLNLAFPNSNKLFAVLADGEACECVCFCLFQIFRLIGYVPSRIVFDNATGIGRRVFNVMNESELFTRFRLHYGFRSTFTNPRAGYEKGCVENSIGTVRRNMFVPPMAAYRPFSLFNERVLLPESSSLNGKENHYSKGIPIDDLFAQDIGAMEPVNPNDFRIEKMDIIHLSGTGTAKLESKHEYVLGPGLASAKVIVGRGSETVSFYSLDGKLIKSFDRAYSDKPTVNYDLESMLRGLKRKPNSWPNSPVRDAIEDNVFRRYMDDADGKERHRMLYMLSSNAEEFGFGISCVAMGDLFDSGRIPSKDDLASLSRRMQSFPCANSVNPTGVDLKIFDILMGKEA